MTYLKKAFLYFQTMMQLGLKNVAYVAWYRCTLIARIRKRFFPERLFSVDPPFYRPAKIRSDYPTEWKGSLFIEADKIIQGKLKYYAYHWKKVGNPPHWVLNPFNKHYFPTPQKHWAIIRDFNPQVGDIKNIWETSRFAWVVTLSRAYAVSGKTIYLDTLNLWLIDWAKKIL